MLCCSSERVILAFCLTLPRTSAAVVEIHPSASLMVRQPSPVEKISRASALISILPSTCVCPARQRGGHGETIAVDTLGGTNEDASLPRVPRRMSHRLTRLTASVFGSLATIVRGKQTLGPELCVPAFRPVCLYRDTSRRTPMTKTRLSGPSRIRRVLYLLSSFHTLGMLVRRPRRAQWAEPRTTGKRRCSGAPSSNRRYGVQPARIHRGRERPRRPKVRSAYGRVQPHQGSFAQRTAGLTGVPSPSGKRGRVCCDLSSQWSLAKRNSPGAHLQFAEGCVWGAAGGMGIGDVDSSLRAPVHSPWRALLAGRPWPSTPEDGTPTQLSPNCGFPPVAQSLKT